MSSLFAALPFLACPVGMGLMMWMMMRGRKDDSPARQARNLESVGVSSPASVELLREEHRRLGEQLESLEETKRVGAKL